jgi:membrane protein implicated in regulation of membrane protease activity
MEMGKLLGTAILLHIVAIICLFIGAFILEYGWGMPLAFLIIKTVMLSIMISRREYGDGWISFFVLLCFSLSSAIGLAGPSMRDSHYWLMGLWALLSLATAIIAFIHASVLYKEHKNRPSQPSDDVGARMRSAYQKERDRKFVERIANGEPIGFDRD